MSIDIIISVIFFSLFFFFFADNLHSILFNLLILSILIRLWIYREVRSWLAAIILLLYAGGLLILFFYLISLCSNTSKDSNTIFKFSGVLVFFLILFFKVNIDSNSRVLYKYSEFFIQDYFLAIIVILLLSLLLVLWRVRKITMKCSGPMRPWF